MGHCDISYMTGCRDIGKTCGDMIRISVIAEKQIFNEIWFVVEKAVVQWISSS